MRRSWYLVVGIGCFALVGWAHAADVQENWQRIDSRYCTIWLHPSVEAKKVNRKVNTWRVRPQIRAGKNEKEESQLGAKCDALFRRAEEILDMYPPGIHTTLKVARNREELNGVHTGLFGYGTEAVAFYAFEENTIYTTEKDISESVLAHEMAHCVIDHYFRIRPPRKIEELLAMHVDAHLRE